SQAIENDGGVIKISLKDHSLNYEDDLAPPADLAEGKYIRLTVTDTGPGIAPQHLDRIFDPYFTTKGIGEGSGMGLSVVHGIVKAHRGAIRVSSEPGKGTEFNIFFPVIEERPKIEVRAKEDASSGHERILFVDDDRAIAEMTKESLERLGFNVNAFLDPLEALESFKADPQRFDLVITDMAMPNLTGEKLAQRVLAIKPDIPIIICTGYSATIDNEKAKQMGVAGFLMKPVTLSTLSKTIRKILDELNG
ncbi:MAG TPA: sensory box histidine kinase/response regulator protein, partial [Desulfobacteraceae bacterium]|nr:sensory box histidine kinase/response regulator protein [Desulfobacteraceae bacterium]